MGSRSRKRRDAPPAAPKARATRGPSYGETATPPAKADRNATMKRGYARAEQRNQQLRESLEPLAPGERPGAVTVAAIVALVLAIVNGVAVATGENIGGDDARPAGIGLTLIILVAAAGMWKAKYWAVLGFQALLTLQLIIAFLALLVVEDLWRAAVFVAIIGLGGWLFWKLIRAMARLQMPVR
jgi:hypothetical protein